MRISFAISIRRTGYDGLTTRCSVGHQHLFNGFLDRQSPAFQPCRHTCCVGQGLPCQLQTGFQSGLFPWRERSANILTQRSRRTRQP